MKLSDISVTRPVFAAVISLLLVAFGLVSFDRLPLREYPDIDPPVVSIDTTYRGASANIVETRITELIEDRISGVEGIKYIQSTSTDGRSRINIEFNISRDIEAATNDVRDRVSSVTDDLPPEADPPDVQKADSSDDVILWLHLTSDRMNTLELTDYAKRYLQDRFSVLPGVARIRIGGGLEYAMRIWLDRTKLASHGLTVVDVEDALRRENVELPAGNIESTQTQFTVRIKRAYATAADFEKMVIAQRDKTLTHLGDVAKIEKTSVENRTFFNGNGIPMIGIGIIKQSKANTIDIANSAIKLANSINGNLPAGMSIGIAYDTSVFVKNAIKEVYKTLLVATLAVVTIIFLFIGNFRATLIPAITVPISLIATFTLLLFFGFSINLLTLLALVLATGLVVDDAIVVIENISRRIEQGMPPLSAAYYGTRQVGFAVIATSVVLVSVFVPIIFIQGDLGRLFGEFAISMAAAVFFSTIVSLSLCPMLASKLLTNKPKHRISFVVDQLFISFKKHYTTALQLSLHHRKVVMTIAAFITLSSVFIFYQIPSEYAPREDRGAMFILVNAAEGASYEYTKQYMEEIEKRLISYVKSAEATRLIVRAPRGFGTASSYNDGIVILVLNDWNKRRSAFVIMREIAQALSDLPGVRAFPIMRQAFGRGISKPVQFVIGGGTYEELAQWRDILLKKIEVNNPGLIDIDSDYKETKPQIRVTIDKDRAADLGVATQTIGRTLETMLGSRRVTTYIDQGEEYDVILEGRRETQNSPSDLQNIYVRSAQTNQLIPLVNLVKLQEFADSGSLNRYNRVRAITIEAGLKDGYSLGEALTYLRQLVHDNLPASVIIDYKGESLDYTTSGKSLLFTFILGAIIVFLVLAAQFESFIHPMIIILSVPLAMLGALLGLLITGNTLNVYTEIGMIMLMGLAAKNGILIVEFINQLRDGGMEFSEAIITASQIRLRPIVMTSITTMAGTIPLLLAFGAGAETRISIGTVVFFGVAVATCFTLFVVPVAYDILAKNTGSPGDVKRKLKLEEQNK